MIQIRENCFETNSSSVHSICMCTKSEYDKWAQDWGHLNKSSFLYFRWDEKFVTVEEAANSSKTDIENILNLNAEEHDNTIEILKEDYWTMEDYENEDYLEKYYTEYTTSNGEVVVAFGMYGYDG